MSIAEWWRVTVWLCRSEAARRKVSRAALSSGVSRFSQPSVRASAHRLYRCSSQGVEHALSHRLSHRLERALSRKASRDRWGADRTDCCARVITAYAGGSVTTTGQGSLEGSQWLAGGGL